jgi:transposase
LQPRLIAAQFVTPFRKSRGAKNDRNDAEAIATAARQGNMRFVAVKRVDQQARLAWHRAREGFKTECLALTNRLRGLLAESASSSIRRRLRCAGPWPIASSARTCRPNTWSWWAT